MAAHANVSIGTVDRVIHNRGEVSAKTAERVNEAIDKLGYQPNLIARSLATKVNHKLAVFLPDSTDTNDYWHYPILGIRQAIDEISDHGINIRFYFFDLKKEEDFLKKGKLLISDAPDVVITAPMFMGNQNTIFSQLDQHGIKYVLIDSDVSSSSRMAFVGQHSERSGLVAGRLMSSLINAGDNILITNIQSGSDIIPVIQKRIKGFSDYLGEHRASSKVFELNMPLESNSSGPLIQHIEEHQVKGVFVPSSRAHIVADFLKDQNAPDIKIIGYDLIKSNIKYLKDGLIDCLISQRPAKQGYHGVMSLFNHLVKKENSLQNIILPIDIILKENVDDYISSIQL
ncbi:LacI family DNA-binding transcriptional regulator [Reichenbachiella sp. MALMAid0571]|uniref:LacI family DNA-binding transcriptional regulator n=1 Tax=Reichenbachiella sp. MALMAid0571 TaxID=3143939 RepID=UPI0032DFD611